MGYRFTGTRLIQHRQHWQRRSPNLGSRDCRRSRFRPLHTIWLFGVTKVRPSPGQLYPTNALRPMMPHKRAEVPGTVQECLHHHLTRLPVGMLTPLGIGPCKMARPLEPSVFPSNVYLCRSRCRRSWLGNGDKRMSLDHQDPKVYVYCSL